jgi:hypothetical protein
MKFLCGAAVLLVSCLWGIHAEAAGFRCGSYAIDTGDSLESVRQKCGTPAEVKRQDILQQPSFVRDGKRYFFGEQLVQVPVEIWLYNFGPNKLMRRLRFVDGVLENIETLGYGYR